MASIKVILTTERFFKNWDWLFLTTKRVRVAMCLGDIGRINHVRNMKIKV